MELTEQEKKLLRLGLDPAAQVGEIQGGAVKFFGSLRRRGVTADQLENIFSEDRSERFEQAPPKQSVPDYGLQRMPFCRHKGELFMDIPPMDLVRQPIVIELDAPPRTVWLTAGTDCL